MNPLKKALKLMSMSQTELSLRLRVSRITVNSWCNGRTIPTKTAAQRLNVMFPNIIQDLVEWKVEA